MSHGERSTVVAKERPVVWSSELLLVKELIGQRIVRWMAHAASHEAEQKITLASRDSPGTIRQLWCNLLRFDELIIGWKVNPCCCGYRLTNSLYSWAILENFGHLLLLFYFSLDLNFVWAPKIKKKTVFQKFVLCCSIRNNSVPKIKITQYGCESCTVNAPEIKIKWRIVKISTKTQTAQKQNKNPIVAWIIKSINVKEFPLNVLATLEGVAFRGDLR